jgi:hypothetical protein
MTEWNRSPELKALDAVGIGTVLSVDLDENYQGTVAAVVRGNRWRDRLAAEEKIAVLIIGYGSCSGCDEWEAMEYTPVDRLDYLVTLMKSAKWFDNLADLQSYVAGIPVDKDRYDYNSDHSLQWYGHDQFFPEFQRLVAGLKDGDELPVAVA